MYTGGEEQLGSLAMLWAKPGVDLGYHHIADAEGIAAIMEVLDEGYGTWNAQQVVDDRIGVKEIGRPLVTRHTQLTRKPRVIFLAAPAHPRGDLSGPSHSRYSIGSSTPAVVAVGVPLLSPNCVIHQEGNHPDKQNPPNDLRYNPFC